MLISNVLTKEFAQDFLDGKLSSLDHFTSIEDDAAEILSNAEGALYLASLTTLSDSVAESLSNKKGGSGFVEKYRAPEDHEVVGQNDESEFADLSPSASRSNMIPESAFNH